MPFDSSSDALHEIDAVFRRSQRVIIPLTVREILDEQIAKKLAQSRGSANSESQGIHRAGFTVIVPQESAFRRIPVSLDKTQASFLDAIRLCAELADLAYTRLVQHLDIVSTREGPEMIQIGDAATIFLHAWSIVDAVHRLREIVDQMPGLKKNEAELQLFRRDTASVSILRNTVQHLRNELHTMAQNNWSVWGSLVWLKVIDASKGLIRWGCVLPGRHQTHAQTLFTAADRPIYASVDYVTLYCKEDSVDLSRCLRRIETVIRMFENNLVKQFHGSPTVGSDLIFFLDAEHDSLDISVPHAPVT